MTERPILMSAPMIKAILAGTKTQTRRPVKWRGVESGLNLQFSGLSVERSYDKWVLTSPTRDSHAYRSAPITCPYGLRGDRLRVKEAAWMWCERRPNGKTKTGRQKWLYVPMREAGIFYAADHPTKPTIGVVSPNTGNQWGWRLKIGRFLPAWASRITLEVTGVRVERLQDISEADAQAEGCGSTVDYEVGFTYVHEYAELWKSINGPGSWDANPWVWVVEFKRVMP